PVADGAAVDTQTAGAHEFTVTATDNAGNSATKTVHFTVTAPSSPPPSSPPPSSPPPSSPPAPVTVDIGKLLAALVKSVTMSHGAALAKGSGKVVQTVPGAGVLQDYVLAAGSALPKVAAVGKPVVFASGSHRFAGAGTATVKLRLTKGGKKRLAKRGTVKLLLETVFTPAGGKPVLKTRQVTLKR
ncbi:MAG: hypothetical protein JWN32_2119, partial [Solirubrobacterales bacterium]|nr:hypothetical protein [Solirubrobacterales bacterium]